MSRISNNSFAVNSSLEQIVEVSGGSIIVTPSGTQNVDVVGNSIGLATNLDQITGNASLANIDANTSGLATELTATNISLSATSIDGKITVGEDDTLLESQQVLIYGRKDDAPTGLRALKVNDNGALITFDATLNAKITKGNDITLSEAQQVLVYGEVTAGPGAGDLHPIHISQAGDVQVEISGLEVKGQDTMANSLPVVIASDQSAIPVTSETSAHSGSQANLFSSASVIAGDTSNVITTTKSLNISIFGNTTDTVNGVDIEMSADNSAWYPCGFSVFPDTSGNFCEVIKQTPANYWRIKVKGSATITATLIHN